MRLLTFGEAGELLRVRDRRTVRKRLHSLGVPTFKEGRSELVDENDLRRAIELAKKSTRGPGGEGPFIAGVDMTPGKRLGEL